MIRIERINEVQMVLRDAVYEKLMTAAPVHVANSSQDRGKSFDRLFDLSRLGDAKKVLPVCGSVIKAIFVHECPAVGKFIYRRIERRINARISCAASAKAFVERELNLLDHWNIEGAVD